MTDKKMSPDELKWHRLHDPMGVKVVKKGKPLTGEAKRQYDEFVKAAWASFEKNEKSKNN